MYPKYQINALFLPFVQVLFFKQQIVLCTYLMVTSLMSFAACVAFLMSGRSTTDV